MEGAEAHHHLRPSVTALKDFLGRFEPLPISPQVVEASARTRPNLRSRGRVSPDVDLAIAATALAHDLTLVPRNRHHFDRIVNPRLFDEA